MPRKRPSVDMLGRTAACGALVLASLLQEAQAGTTFQPLRGVVQIQGGQGHSCARLANGGLKCWGGNGIGQLGDGTNINRRTAVDVNGLGGGTSWISAGHSHSCGALGSGGARCWGWNQYGQLGDGSITHRNAPVAVIDLSGSLTQIAAGWYHSCAIPAAGGVKCWGYNLQGQLGNGTNDNTTSPVEVTALITIGMRSVAVGQTHTCVVTGIGGVYCWGGNTRGQLGDGSTTNRNAPVSVIGLGSGVLAVTAGGHHTCALTLGGGVKCWGWNSAGQVGDNTGVDRSTPVDVAGLTSGVLAISASPGGDHTCALTNTFGLKCWGFNNEGQLGDGTLTPRLAPVDVVGLTSGVGGVGAGQRHSCAILSNDETRCWGDNFYGQLGNNTQTDSLTPQTVLVEVPAGNQPPTANDDSASVDEDSSIDIDVAGNDTDPDGNLDPGSVNTGCSGCSAPAHGSLQGQGGGVLRYTPAADYFGSDVFIYEVCDTQSACDTATVNLSVQAINDAPAFLPGPAQVFPGGSQGTRTAPGWASDIDLGPGENGQSVLAFTVVPVADPDGVVSGLPAIDNGGNLSFELSGNAGTAEFSVTLRDDGGNSGLNRDTSEPHPLRIGVGTAADLAVAIEQCTARTAPGSAYRFAVRADQLGPDPALDLFVMITVPVGTTVLDTGTPDCVRDGTNVVCLVGMLEPLQSYAIPLQVEMPDIGAAVVDLLASASTATDDPNPANDAAMARVQLVPGMVTTDSFESCDGSTE